MAEVKGLLSGAFRRLKNSRISFSFSCLILCAAVAFPVSTAVLQIWALDDWTALPATSLTSLAVVCLLIFVQWTLTRVTGDFGDRKGAFWPWAGWGMLAYLPTIIVVIILAIATDGEDSSIPETIAFALLPPFFAPWLVHASGRAIDAAGPWLEDVISYWKPRYFSLVVAYILATVPATLLSEAIYLIDEESLLVDIAASLAYLPAMVLGTVLTVEAFHRLPQESSA